MGSIEKSHLVASDRDSGYAVPPPYAPSSPNAQFYSPAPSMSSRTSTGTTIKFPRKFLYHYRWFSSTSYLGPSKEEPLFVVKTPNKMICIRRKEIIIQDGIDKLNPPLASVGPEKGSKGTRSMIRVAPKPGAPKDDCLEISMSGDYSLTHKFTLPLENGRVERFEWRNTKGDEVRELSGGFNLGWKLVRMDGPVIVPDETNRGKGYTSDGKEVVAVGAHPRWFKSSPQFEFLGCGARGELGETFEVVAVTSFVRLYELHVQQQTMNSAAASSA